MNKNLSKIVPLKIENLLSKNIFFMHIPKCGGTTIDHIFSRYAFASKKIDFLRITKGDKKEVNILENIEKVINESSKPFYLSGHLNEDFFNNLNKPILKATIIRNPIDRIISRYKFFIYKKNLGHPEKYSLEKFLNENKQHYQDNMVVRMLSNNKNRLNEITENDYENAMNNILSFDLVFDFSEWKLFTNILTSFFDFPTIFYKNYQEHNYNFDFFYQKNDLKLINKFDYFDKIFYEKLFKEKKFYSRLNFKEKNTRTNLALLVDDNKLNYNKEYLRQII